MKLSSFRRNHNISVLFQQLNHVVRYYETKLQQKPIRNVKNDKDVRGYSMSISEIGQLAQKKNDLQITAGMLNNARIRNQLDLLYTIVLPSQNRYEMLFKDKSKFVRLNSIIGSLLRKVDGKNYKTTIDSCT